MKSVVFSSLVIIAVVPALYAQQKPNPVSGGAAGNGSSIFTGSNGTLGSRNNNPVINVAGPNSSPIFLTGDVLFDDGTPPNTQVKIERMCGSGGTRVETHTDSKGHFSFQVGGERGNNVSEADYSSNTFGSANGLSNAPSTVNATLMGCELRAVYPGYLSQRVDVSSHHPLDEAQVGTIILHRLSEVKGTTISVTTAEAPRSAQKAYEKGKNLVQKGKLEDALSLFSKATSEDAKFAEAWVALGELQQQLNKMEEAKASFLAAIAADDHYVTPFERAAWLYSIQKDWPNAAKYSKRVIELNPVEFPSAFWYNAFSNYNLKNNVEAEKSARALTKLDSTHRYPEVETMLAEFAYNRGELSEAAAHLKNYLADAPTAKNADLVKRELAQVEAARATQAKTIQAPQAH